MASSRWSTKNTAERWLFRLFGSVSVRLIAALALSQWVVGHSRAEPAPDVVVLCDPSLQWALVAAGRAWEAKNHVPVRVLAASLEQNTQLAIHGARADILIGLGTHRIDEAEQLGAIDRGSPTVIGHDPIVLVVRGAAAEPLRLAPGASISGLLADGRFGLVDTAFGSAGPDARAALAEVGLWPGLKPRSVGAATTDSLTALLSDGSVRVAALYKTDLAGHPKLAIAATFPTLAPPVAAAMSMNPQSPHAKDFLAFLVREGQSSLQQNGMEPP